MTDARHGELVSIIGLAGQTNHMVTALQIPVDPQFEVRGRASFPVRQGKRPAYIRITLTLA